MGTPLYDVNKGVNGRDGGPYLDEIEAQEAERRRAFIENREPDLDNPGPYQGSVLVDAETLIQNHNSTRHGKFEGEIKVDPVAEVPDADGDGIPDSEDEDFVPPSDENENSNSDEFTL